MTDSLADVAVLTGSVTLDDEELTLLARLVAAELGSSPYMAQVCLAAMVLNRLEEYDFPSTVREIVYDSGDFESVKAGLVAAHPDGNESSSRYRIALRAVKEALGGKDPTDGALYFSRVGSAEMYLAGSYECGGVIFGR